MPKLTMEHIPARYQLIAILSIVVLVGLLLLTIRVSPPPTSIPVPRPIPPINVRPNAAPSTLFQIPNQLNTPKVPENEYKFTDKILNPTEQAALFGFSTAPTTNTPAELAKRYSWKEDERSLIIDVVDGPTSLFYGNGDGTKHLPPTLDINTADKIVRDFVQNRLNLPSNISLIPLHSEYALVQGNSGKITQIPQEANTTSLSYVYQLESIPLYVSTSTPYSIRATVSGDGTIIQLFAYLIPQLESVPNPSSIAIDQAVLTVREGKAALYEAYPSEMAEGLPDPNYSSVIVNSITPAYLYDNNNHLFRSVYKVEGSASDNNIPQLKYKVIYLTPAKL